MRRFEVGLQRFFIDGGFTRLHHNRHLIGFSFANTLDHAEIFAVGARILDDDRAHCFGKNKPRRGLQAAGATRDHGQLADDAGKIRRPDLVKRVQKVAA